MIRSLLSRIACRASVLLIFLLLGSPWASDAAEGVRAFRVVDKSILRSGWGTAVITNNSSAPVTIRLYEPGSDSTPTRTLAPNAREEIDSAALDVESASKTRSVLLFPRILTTIEVLADGTIRVTPDIFGTSPRSGKDVCATLWVEGGSPPRIESFDGKAWRPWSDPNDRICGYLFAVRGGSSTSVRETNGYDCDFTNYMVAEDGTVEGQESGCGGIADGMEDRALLTNSSTVPVTVQIRDYDGAGNWHNVTLEPGTNDTLTGSLQVRIRTGQRVLAYQLTSTRRYTLMWNDDGYWEIAELEGR